MRALLICDMRIFSYFKHVLLFLVLLQVSTSCEEDEISDTSVVTEEIIFISGEVVRLTGRVLEISGDKLDDHGFVIADNEGFSSPITISLGEKTLPGRFVGEFSGLELETSYFSRSFVSSGGQTFFGNTKTFSTLPFTIEDFSPKTALPGATLKITGTNFPEGTRVFFDDEEATIDQLNFESEIIVTIPEITDSETINISVMVGDEQISFSNQFEYIFGFWESVSVFPNAGLQYHENMFLQDGDDFIFGLGRDFDFASNSRVFKFDLKMSEWSEISFPGTGTRHPFNGGNLFGSGGIGFGPFYTILNEFWEYSAGTFTSKGVVPFALYKSVSYKMGDDLFVAGGFLVDNEPNTNIYRYNETSDTWFIDGQIPFEVSTDYPHFVLNGKVYFIVSDGGVWEYDPTVSSDMAWTSVSQVPEVINEDGVAYVINGKAYIGTFRDSQNMYEYDVATNTWKEKVDFIGNASDDTIGSFTYKDKLYILKAAARGGLGFVDTKMELWSFDPSAL